MRKSVIITLLFCLYFSTQSFAQKKLKLGLNVGGQYTNLRGFNYPVKGDFELGIMFGANIEYIINDELSIVAAFNSEQLVKKKEITYFDNNANQSGAETFKEKHNFFNIPLLFRYKFGGKKQFFIDGGGFVNYFNKAESNEFNPLFINFEDYNYGLAFGVGTIFYFKNNTDIGDPSRKIIERNIEMTLV